MLDPLPLSGFYSSCFMFIFEKLVSVVETYASDIFFLTFKQPKHIKW